MKENLPFSATTPGSGIRFRNLHAASLSRFPAAIALLLILSLSLSHAVQRVTLAWDASSNPSIAGYKLRYGTTSGNPSQIVDVGKTTTATASNLNDATTYFFTVTAYNTAALESPPSNEVSYTTPGPSGSIGRVPSAPMTGGPLRKHPTNPRYFTDDSGRAIYLTGSHFWTTIQERNEAKTESRAQAFETFQGYLDFLKSRNHNFTRLWCFDHFDYENTPSPWVRTGPGTAFDGKPKWDVSKVNQAYLDRLRDRVRQFRDNGIYVSVMFFRGNYSKGTSPRWDGHPFKPTNNVNAELAGLTYDAYNATSHARCLELQKHYIRGVVDALNDMDNVIWEIANEAQPESYPWQQHLVDYVRSYESGKPKQHLVGITSTSPKDNLRLYATTADWISSGAQRGYDANNPPVANRIIISDTDHHLLWDARVSWVWKSFHRGEQPIYMENELAPTYGDLVLPPPQILEDVRRAMAHTLKQANRMNLAAMTPRNDLAQTAYCLANPGVEYLVYAPSAGTFWVDLSSRVGRTFAVEWINPSTGAILAGANVAGGSSRHSFTAPLNDDGAVLYLKSTSPPPSSGGLGGE